MEINPAIEEHVRDAFAAVVGEERDRFDAALNGLSDDDGPKAWQYAAFVVGYVVNLVQPDGVQDDTLDRIAQRAIDATKSWFDLGSREQVKALLRASAEGAVNMPGVPREKAADMTFVLGSYLLQAYRGDDQHWWDFLDEVWAALQAVPEPS